MSVTFLRTKFVSLCKLENELSAPKYSGASGTVLQLQMFS